jgi:hypothetical protein
MPDMMMMMLMMMMLVMEGDDLAQPFWKRKSTPPETRRVDFSPDFICPEKS